MEQLNKLIKSKFKVVYTAIFSDKDNLPEVTPTVGVRFVCFTDSLTMRSKTWEIIQVLPKFYQSTPRKTARWFKLHPFLLFPNSKYIMWKDAPYSLERPIKDFFDLLGENELAVFEHPRRTCLYDEAKICSEWKLDNAEVIQKQIAKYKAEEYPENNGLAETGFVVWHRTELTEKLVKIWWEELDNNCVRDQVSFPYACWKVGASYSIIPKSYNPSRYKPNGKLGQAHKDRKVGNDIWKK